MDQKKSARSLLYSLTLLSPLIINKLTFLIAAKKHPFISANRFYEWRLGKIGYSIKGNGKPIVLIHGAKPGSSSAVWLKNINSLAENYKVYTIDLPGYGSSERINTTYTAYTVASMIDDFITDIVKKPAAVIAEGEGAMFAACACKKNPKNFKKFIFICPKGIDSPVADNADGQRKSVYELPIIGESLYLMASSFTSIEKELSEMIYSENKRRILKEKFYSAAHYGGAANRFVYASYKNNFMNIDIKPYIREFNIPMLFLWGEKAVDAGNMEKVQQLTAKAQYAIFEETASLPNYENYIEFNKLAKEFM